MPDEESHVDIVAAEQQAPAPPPDDVDRAPVPGEPPPAPGAQWDEVHRRWERWDEASQSWVVVGDPGDGMAPGEENPLPPLLARELHHAEELEQSDAPDVPDVERLPEPEAELPGAQWNEVAGRWERWDDAAGAWVAVGD